MRPENYCETHFTCGNIDDVRCVVDPSHMLSQGCPLCVWGQNIAWVINFVARYFIFVLLISRVDVVFLFSKLACGNQASSLHYTDFSQLCSSHRFEKYLKSNSTRLSQRCLMSHGLFIYVVLIQLSRSSF